MFANFTSNICNCAKFTMDNLRDQQFCTPLCELELELVLVLFNGNTLEVEVSPGMVCPLNTVFASQQHEAARGVPTDMNSSGRV